MRAAADADAHVPSHRTLPPFGLLAEPAFREGFACLQPFGASFDTWLYHPQLIDLVDFARAFPDMSIVVNHVGGLLGVGRYAEDRPSVVADWRGAQRPW